MQLSNYSIILKCRYKSDFRLQSSRMKVYYNWKIVNTDVTIDYLLFQLIVVGIVVGGRRMRLASIHPHVTHEWFS